MTDVTIAYHDETYVKIIADRSILSELSEHFSFYIPSHRFNPKVKAGVWDGKIRMLNLKTRLIYKGLIDKIKQFCDDNDYTVETNFDNSNFDISENELLDFIKSLNIPEKFENRQYQIDIILHAIKTSRSMLLVPTNGGKTFITYILARFYNVKTLIICPTINLVNQLQGDFKEYGYNNNVHVIMAGKEKQTDAMIVCSTYQSIFRMPEDYFKQFDVIIGDEAHLYDSNSLKSLMEKANHTKVKIGMTGSLKGSKTNEITLEGLFGPSFATITTAEMIEQGYSSPLLIKCCILNYSDEEKKNAKKFNYQDELAFLYGLEKRNKFIIKLSLALEGNSILLFNRIDTHGKLLLKLLKEQTKKPIYYVDGSVKGDVREQIRHIVNKEKNCILAASEGTFSTGVNIKNLHNGIFASPSKARVKNLQSIGRGLRIKDNNNKFVLYDIADNLIWKKHKNYTIEHFYERIKLYSEEQLDYKMIDINI